MKSEQGARRAYASLRVQGDSLDPEQVTRTLRIYPTLAYAKGMKYYAGERSGELVGRTGVWLLSTKGIVASENLYHHLIFIIGVLFPNPKDISRLTTFRALLLKNKDLRADIACFWHGRFGEKRPSIPREITEFLKIIPAELELDFETDSDETERKQQA
jgi:hypothetical protein